ncbi:hypothetical protein niasHT_031363 [Heterodera trifolii]|uniref:F-box domain-containing protein n=1 Tax=Heterodera trifolii TaxID=157864 RepID=A0ABD2IWU6_9BILA
MSDSRKEAEEKMAKAIFISADCWLCVFDLLSPRQLGLGIAMISHRFDYYVDEHFKTRKWTLKFIRIRSKIGENGTKEMEIVNYYVGQQLPIPQIPMPRKVIGFERIDICFIDRNAIAFLRRFRQLFASIPINLNIYSTSDRISDFLLRNIWPMIGKNICGMHFSADVFRRLRKFVPSILNDCPSLRFVISCAADFFTEFPANDNAMALNAHAVAKWLFAPRPDDVPKVLICLFHSNDGNWSSKIEASKAAFTNASSPVNFIVVLWFNLTPFAVSVVLFNLTNELTREQLALKGTKYRNCFLLVRCPIARDADKWTKWEEEAIGWQIYYQRNRINIKINGEEDIGDGLLDATPGSSDRQQKCMNE